MGLTSVAPEPQPGTTRSTPLRIWVVSDGRAGIENQALGLAEAIAELRPAEIVVKRLLWPRWARRVPSRLLPASPKFLHVGREGFQPPWPDLWIGNGRASLPLSIGVRQWSKGETFVVQLQDPLRPSRLFDLVIPPSHDRLAGDNVFPILGTPHRVTRARLDLALAEFGARLAPLPHPRIAVLIGGKAKAYGLSPARAEALAGAIRQAVVACGGALMMTFSRRTPSPARHILTEGLQDLPGWIWDDTGDNPFFAFLAAADAILVTEDSANMPAEAAATGKPVYLLPMDGGQSRRARFHQALEAAGVTRRFSGKIDNWTYEPLRETERAAREVLRRFAIRQHEMVLFRSSARRMGEG